jgi:peptidoglycan/LPS O-acetylase OafA/YrhL
MRAVAALSVVYYHVAFRFPQPTGGLQRFATQRNAGPPISAVVLFFLISGFVLYRPFVLARMRGAAPPALVPYFVKRFARIVPGYWVALAIVSAWLGYGYVFRPAGFVRYFGFLQLYGNHTTAGGGLSVAWTLCVEVTFYATLPLLALAARALGRRLSLLGSELAVCAAMVAASLVWQLAITLAVPESNGWFLSLLSMLPGSLDLFAAGMLLAIFSSENELRATPRGWVALAQRRTWVWWLLAGVALYFEGMFPGNVPITVAWMGTHALKLVGCALLLMPLVFGGGNRGLIRRVLGAAPVVWLGTVSYGIYLWHFPLLGKLAPHLHGELATTLVVILASVVAGALSYYIVERPAQLAARRLIVRMRSRPGVVAPAPIAVSAAAPPPDRP